MISASPSIAACNRPEQALKDIVAEVLRTETELIDSFTRATNDLESDGKGHAEQMAGTLASLLEDINGAPDMETLKFRALSHIRTLRDQIKTRRAQEVSRQQAHPYRDGPGPGGPGRDQAAHVLL